MGDTMTTPWNQLALKLEKDLPKDKSSVYSPLSLWIAMAMVEGGAEGKTKDELRTSLALGKMSTQQIGDQLRKIGNSKNYEIGIANGLWPSANHKYEQEYIAEIRKNFDADFNPLDFAKDTEGSRLKINAWVDQKTRGKIKEVISKNTLDRQTLFVLTNAIYFKGSWEHPFQEFATKKKDFFLTTKKTIQIPAMTQTRHFKYFENAQVQALAMEYTGSEMFFLVLLPRAGKTLKEANPQAAQEAIGKWSERKVEVQLPRFKIEADLPDVPKKLKSLGIRRVFEENEAELGKIMKPELGRLVVSNIIHKAMIDVNEAGTEAAAATVVEMRITGMPQPEKTVAFTANRPFKFYIVHSASKSILFAGQYLGN
jgi:serpin B